MHESHEGCSCIGETKGEDQEFTVSTAGSEGSPGGIVRVDADLVETSTEINLGESCGT